MDLQLQGKRALVTGGSRGIGKAIARVLIEEGCAVAISARDPERLAAAAEELGGISWFAYDAADDESVESMVTGAAEALGGLDVLVNNAASPGSVHGPMKLADLTADHALADLQVKVLGLSALLSGGCAVHAVAGLGTDRERVGAGGSWQREHGGIDPQCVGGGDDEESGG